VRTLADYAIARHYPEAAQAAKPYRALLDGVIGRQARLIAQWMNLGFIHGVMNTDNMSISGETIDFGPCAFTEAYDPNKVFSSIDSQGRYAYSNQPHAAHWNLARLAESLLPLLVEEAGGEQPALDSAHEALDGFGTQYETARLAGLRRKLGLFTEQDGDEALAEDLLQKMAANQADFTQTFRRLGDAAASPAADGEARALFTDPRAFDSWAHGWRQRLARENVAPHDRAASMRVANPIYIPRNHLVQAAIDAAVERRDFQPFEELLEAVTHPAEDHPAWTLYATPARPEQCVSQTFCGT